MSYAESELIPSLAVHHDMLSLVYMASAAIALAFVTVQGHRTHNEAYPESL